MDNGKCVRYTHKQVEASERLYHKCPKPISKSLVIVESIPFESLPMEVEGWREVW